jgi:glycosyltransferase involved in cell wall biosynthesis
VKRIVSTVENAHEWGGANGVKGRAKYLAYRRLAKGARVIAVSHDICSRLVRHVGLARSQVQVIPNGVDTVQFQPGRAHGESRAELKLPEDALVVGAVGTLSPVKSHDTLVRAMRQVVSQHPNAYFLIVGRGRQDALKSLAEQEGVANRLVFTGMRRDIANVLSSLDVYVMTSLSEGLSISLLEAMAMERPVIASRVGGNVEVINSPAVGVLYDAGDHRALSRELCGLLTSAERRKAMGLMARRRICQAYDIEAAADAYEALYRELQ